MTKFTTSFAFTFFFVLTCFAGALIFIDPKQTVELLPATPFSLYHENFMLKKMQAMDLEPDSFDTLILGSSTSEVFVPVDINDFFGGQSFSAATGGGQTPIRYAFAKKGIATWPKLKRLIYVVDFFEFNRLDLPGEFLYSKKMKEHTPEMSWKASGWDFFKFHLSHQMVESMIGVIKKTLKQEEIVVHADGTTLQSMILSPIDTSKITNAQLSPEQREQLLIQVEENYYTYRHFVLAGFDELNPKTIEVFEQLNTLTETSQVEIIYILAPYQKDFKEKLMSDSKRAKLYSEWRQLFATYNERPHIQVIDPLDSSLSHDPLSIHWRDGIHFDRPSAVEILKAGMR